MKMQPHSCPLIYILRACLSAIDVPNQRTNPDFTLKQKDKNGNDSAIAKDKLVSFLSCCFFFFSGTFF